jgi:hypothetical protein
VPSADFNIIVAAGPDFVAESVRFFRSGSAGSTVGA